MKVRKHAYIRICERSGLKSHEVQKMLKVGAYVPLGIDKKKNNSHKLIYSESDETCFVAIHDEKSDDIVTVLPIDYHGNIAWTIDINILAEAKRIYFEKIHNKKFNVDQQKTLYNADNEEGFPKVLSVTWSANYKTKRLGGIDIAYEIYKTWGMLEIFSEENFKNFFKNNPSKLNLLAEKVIEMADAKEIDLSDIEGSLYFAIGSKSTSRNIFQIRNLMEKIQKKKDIKSP